MWRGGGGREERTASGAVHAVTTNGVSFGVRGGAPGGGLLRSSSCVTVGVQLTYLFEDYQSQCWVSSALNVDYYHWFMLTQKRVHEWQKKRRRSLS